MKKFSEFLYEDIEILEESTKALKDKAAKSGVSLGILKQVYRRGVAAWNSGHRPGTTPQQWGLARVNSFLTGGKTQKTADKDLWAKAKGKSISREKLDEKCWDGYKQEGMKKKGDKMVPNCVPESEEGDASDLPKKYKTGDNKTDAARDAHWDKMAKKSDRDPSAYQDAPGDKEAREKGTKESKYTKKFRDMYGESEEKETDSQKSKAEDKKKEDGLNKKEKVIVNPEM